MARQGLHQHRKFLRLADRLGSAALARGILEMLWEPAYDSGEDFLGDALDIWIRCGKPAGLTKETLRDALLDCGFIDEPGPAAYAIHDLFDHMPDGVARRMQREAVRLQRGTTISELRAEAGRKGAQARWANGKKWQTAGKRLANVLTPPPTPTQREDFAGTAQSASPPPVNGSVTVLDRRKKPRKEPDPRHTPLKARLLGAFRETTGTDYGFQGGKDAGGLAALLGICPDDNEIVRRWREAWTRSGFDRPKDIPDFVSKWNLYAIPQGRAPPRDVRKGVVRAEDMDHSTNVEDEHGNIRL